MQTTATQPVILFFKFVLFVLFLNRILFTIATYKRLQMERIEDLYLQNSFCNQVDHREIGRHTSICIEAGRRLKLSVALHTAVEVVNDTLYRELHFNTIAKTSGVFASVILLGALYSKYGKVIYNAGSCLNESLPVFEKKKLA